MHRETAITLFALICLVTAGCGDSHDQVVRDYLAELQLMATVLEAIETEADAEKAKSKLKAIGKRIKAIEVRKQNLGNPSPDLEQKLKTVHMDRHHKLVIRQLDAMVKIHWKVRGIVQTITKDIPRLY
ncbi:MAG: hypothetical protein VX438_10835 [Planctomycetota bacterium]|jgi:hypothetical protein|nr:hypothetical protein [Planctomycetota bacterium]